MDIMSRNLLVNNHSQHELKSELQRYIPIHSVPQTWLTSFQGEWGSTAADIDPPAPDADISQIKDRLATLSREFRILIAVLLTDLAFQGDTEMRFLGIRLNYNEVTPLPYSTLIPGLSTCTTYCRTRKASSGTECLGTNNRTEYLCTNHVLNSSPTVSRNQIIRKQGQRMQIFLEICNLAIVI